jgi:hypothetical protein
MQQRFAPAATGYQVQSKPDGITWSVIASLEASAKGYADTTLAAATACSYRVRAISATASSTYFRIPRRP